jgi:hypothetical protein
MQNLEEMRMKKSWRILVIVLLAALALSACGGPNYNLYGTWRSDNGALTLIFQQSGHLLAQQQGMVQNLVFTSSGSNSITIKPFEGAPENQAVVYQYSIKGETLSLELPITAQDGSQTGQMQTVTLTRVK